MQLSEIITQARSLINQTDALNSQITNSQLIGWANEAYRAIITRLGAIPEETFTLSSAVGDISLDADILNLLRCRCYNPDNSTYEPLEIISMDTLDNIDSGWASADTGTPKYFVRKNTFTGYLYPQPDTAHIGQVLSLDAIAFPTELSADSDTPSFLPKNLHDLIPHFMAWRGWSQMGQPDRATNEIIYFNTQMKADRQISSKFSGQQNQWRWWAQEQ